MKNFIEDGNTINVTATDTIKSGDMVALTGKIVIAITDAAVNETIACKTNGVFEIPKDTGAVTQGQALYYNATSKKITTTQNTNVLVGYAHEAAESGDATVKVRIL